MNEKSGALPDNENDIQSERKLSAVSTGSQWVSGKNYSSANWTVMVISGSADAAGSGETGLIYRPEHLQQFIDNMVSD
ncbi:hypothetical protein ACMGC7_19020 [Morganella morganii]|uniref:hypothetical protein n=1 Tax=Morganella morganii TaxID=582 RepID=UPI003EBB8A93